MVILVVWRVKSPSLYIKWHDVTNSQPRRRVRILRHPRRGHKGDAQIWQVLKVENHRKMVVEWWLNGGLMGFNQQNGDFNGMYHLVNSHIAIKNDHRVFPLNMVIFHSYVNVYQRVLRSLRERSTLKISVHQLKLKSSVNPIPRMTYEIQYIKQLNTHAMVSGGLQ